MISKTCCTTSSKCSSFVSSSVFEETSSCMQRNAEQDRCSRLSCCLQDLDAHNDEENYGAEGAHYYASAPSGWDDPADSEVLPAYVHIGSNHQDYQQGPAVNRGDSFVSPAMLV